MRAIRRRWVSIAALVAIVLFYGVTQFLPASFWEYPVRRMAINFGLVVFVVSMLLAYRFRESLPNDFSYNSVLLLSSFLTCSVLYLFAPTEFGMGGISGDASFHTAYITKFSEHWGLVDYYYRDLPAFYPPGYFYILGKVASLSGIAPYYMLKWGLAFTAWFLPLTSFHLWRKMTSGWNAAKITYVIFLTPPLLQNLFPNTYTMISYILFVPWWLYFVEGYGVDGVENRRRFYVIGGVIGAAIFLIDYYPFLIGGVALGVSASYKRSLVPIKESAPVLAVASMCSAPFWAPLLWNLATKPSTILHSRYFKESFIDVPLPFVPDPHTKATLVVSALFLIGLFNLLDSDKEGVERSLLILLVSCYVWYLIGYIAVLVDRPLLHARVTYLILIILGVGVGLAQYDFDQGIEWSPGRESVLKITIAVLILFITFQTALNGVIDDSNYQTALNASGPSEELEQTMDMINTTDSVFLANHQIFSYYPVYSYVSYKAYYSHPNAHFSERIDHLRRVTNASSGCEALSLLQSAPYDKIDYILLETAGESYRMFLGLDNFPRSSEGDTLQFSPGLFENEYFSQHPAGRYTLFEPKYHEYNNLSC